MSSYLIEVLSDACAQRYRRCRHAAIARRLAGNLTARAPEMAGLADRRWIQVKLTPGVQPAILAGNRPALHRLFVLLLDNALKYSHNGGAVLVEIELPDTEGRIQPIILPGLRARHLREADLPHIFERFYRAEQNPQLAEAFEPGLPLAKTIARARKPPLKCAARRERDPRFEWSSRHAMPAPSVLFIRPNRRFTSEAIRRVARTVPAHHPVDRVRRRKRPQ